MEITYASVPSPRSNNEDLVIATNDFVVVLDGATAAPGVATGCVHDVVWIVQQLGLHLTMMLTVDHDVTLTSALAEAIRRLSSSHASTCDLGNPDSPSATVAILRAAQDGAVDYLVLADSPIVLETLDGTIIPVVDDRTDHLPAYTREFISCSRNQPGGFWVASTRPEAATHALSGAIELAKLRRAAVLTDGASRLVQRYGRTWRELLDILDRDGPSRLIDLTRHAEAGTPEGEYRGKHHDDATAVLCRFGGR